jgi:hypothetical protein
MNGGRGVFRRVLQGDVAGYCLDRVARAAVRTTDDGVGPGIVECYALRLLRAAEIRRQAVPTLSETAIASTGPGVCSCGEARCM